MAQSWRIDLILESGEALEPPPGTRRLSLGWQMRTYAVVWVDPDRKRFTRIDKQGGSNPNWNWRFSYLVENPNPNKKYTVNIEIYSVAVGLMMKYRLIGKTYLEFHVIPYNEVNHYLEVKRPVAKAKAEAGLVPTGWISTRINVTPYYQEPPPPPKRMESDSDSSPSSDSFC